MNKQRKSNRYLFSLIVVISVIPMILAWLFLKNPGWVSGSSNYGQLILPPVTTERQQLTRSDPFSRDNIEELKGHWVLLNLIAGRDCNELCLDALHKTKQLRLMLNKDLTGVRRAVILLDTGDPEVVAQWWQEDERLLRVKADAPLIAAIKTINGGQVVEGTLLLMDPLGNLMMRYTTGFDPYSVKKDLKKLLRVSQIG